jgi:hypothetical protein
MPGVVRSDNPFTPSPQQQPAPIQGYDTAPEDGEPWGGWADPDPGRPAWQGGGLWEEIAEVEDAYLLRKGDALFVATPVDPAAIVRLTRGG